MTDQPNAKKGLGLHAARKPERYWTKRQSPGFSIAAIFGAIAFFLWLSGREDPQTTINFLMSVPVGVVLIGIGIAIVIILFSRPPRV